MNLISLKVGISNTVANSNSASINSNSKNDAANTSIQSGKSKQIDKPEPSETLSDQAKINGSERWRGDTFTRGKGKTDAGTYHNPNAQAGEAQQSSKTSKESPLKAAGKKAALSETEKMKNKLKNPADKNGDGKVTNEERKAYLEQQKAKKAKAS